MNINEYIPRLIDKKIDKMLGIFGAVCIEGPKWCGKTWTGLHHCKSRIMLGDPAGNFQNRQMAALSPSLVLGGESPRLIDEWQEVPPLWDAVRFHIDQYPEKGLFIMTGSSTPHCKGILHSGTGRIANIRMRPMSLYESGDSNGAVSISDIFNQRFCDTVTGEVHLERLAALIVRGGWPASLSITGSDAQEIPKAYIRAVIDNDVDRASERHRDKNKIELLLKSLARNECTTATNNKIIDDISNNGSGTVNKETLSEYLDVLNRIFLLEDIKPFAPELRSSMRIKQAYKRHFTDPSLACAMLGAGQNNLMDDLNTFGFLFESMCLRDLLTYAEALSAKLFHFQSYNGDEVDAVIQLDDGRWGCIEIKLGMNQVDKAASNLLKIHSMFERNSPSAPTFLAVICGLSYAAYRRSDGVYVLPLTALRP